MGTADQAGAQIGIECPNCHTVNPGLKPREKRKATKRHGVGFWLATILTLGLWALLRAIAGRKQIIRFYRCGACKYEWTP